MTKEFVPYELAVKLKALGFDEPCFATWSGETLDMSLQIPSDDYFTKAPTFSQAFRWFREKYQIFPEVLTDCTTKPKFAYTYNTFYGNPKDLTEKEWGWENNIGHSSLLYSTYEEAELACLIKLIEIVEQQM
jgi:hypothetical protein